MVTNKKDYKIFLSQQQLDNGEEIEKYIVSDVVKRHKDILEGIKSDCL